MPALSLAINSAAAPAQQPSIDSRLEGFDANVSPGTPGYGNYQDWISHTRLEQQISLEDYSVSNRGLRAGLVGTGEQVAERIIELEKVGVGLLLLQFSPQLEEMERFAETVIPLVREEASNAASQEALA